MEGSELMAAASVGRLAHRTEPTAADGLPETHQALQRIHSTKERLVNLVDELTQRLQPVLRAPGPENKLASGHHEFSSPVAREIADAEQTLDVQTDRLAELIQRLEV